MKLLSPKFPSATSALTWIFEHGYGDLHWSEAYAKVVNEINGSKFNTCLTVLVFPDESRLPPNDSALDIYRNTN